MASARTSGSGFLGGRAAAAGRAASFGAVLVTRAPVAEHAGGATANRLSPARKETPKQGSIILVRAIIVRSRAV